MRIPSGSTDQVLYFVAFDADDASLLKTGLTGFTVYRSRNGSTPVAMTTPTITEVSASNMEGVYTLLLDEDTTLAAGHDSEEMVFHISCSGMKDFMRIIEIYRPKITQGKTLLDEVLADISPGVLNAGQSITIESAIRAIFNRFYREATQTLTTQAVKNDSGTIVASMAISDNSTTQTKGSA